MRVKRHEAAQGANFELVCNFRVGVFENRVAGQGEKRKRPEPGLAAVRSARRAPLRTAGGTNLTMRAAADFHKEDAEVEASHRVEGVQKASRQG